MILQQEAENRAGGRRLDHIFVKDYGINDGLGVLGGEGGQLWEVKVGLEGGFWGVFLIGTRNLNK